MPEGIEIRLNTNYLKERAVLFALTERTVFTDPINALYDYS